jgi:hypothetical protein
MYPHERSLVKRLAGKRFALVGINSDKDLGALQSVMEREQITWPSWFDGGSTSGPIASAYRVTSWPSVFVLDPTGVIRFKDVRGADLDRAVDSLLDEFGLTGVVGPPGEKAPAKTHARPGPSNSGARRDKRSTEKSASPD